MGFMQENLNSQKQSGAFPFKISDDILKELDQALREESKNKKGSTPNTNLENEINELDFDFLPLTNGLGFHQPEEKKVQAHFTQKIVKKPTMPVYNQNIAMKLETQEQPINRADLSPFYNSGKNSFDMNPLFSDSDFQKLKSSSYKDQKIEVKEISKAKLEVHFEKADLQEQVSAWAIDVVIITALLLSTVYLNFALSGFYQLEQIKGLMSLVEGFTYFAPLFIFYYLFYFTILDRAGSLTIGKKIMGIQIRSLRGEHLGFTQTFLRAGITLLSVLAFGLPLLMDFQGKLTDSEVIKK